MYFVIHTKIPVVWNEFAREQRLVRSLSVSGYDLLLEPLWSFVGNDLCGNTHPSLGQFRLMCCYRLRGVVVKENLKEAVFSSFWNKDDKTFTSFSSNFVWNRRDLQLSYNRCVLAAVFKMLLIAVTLAWLWQPRSNGTGPWFWVHSDWLWNV